MLSLAVIFALGMAPLPASAAAPQIEFKIATIAPEGSTWMKLMHELDERVRTETGGSVGFKFYPGGQQGSDIDVLRKIRSGQLQGGGLTGVGLGEIEPSLRIMELPFMFRDSNEVELAHEMLDPTFEQRLRGRGFELLGWAEVGFVYLYSQQPVRGTDDLRPLKMWLWEGDPLAKALLDELGVSPVPLNITDVLTSLQTGIINTVYTTPYGCLSLQWFTRLKYVTDLRISHAMGAVVISKKDYDKLSPAEIETVRRLSADVFGRLNAATRQQNDEALAVLLQQGLQRVAPDEASTAAFRVIGQRVWERMTGVLYERDLLERLTAALEQSRH